MEQAEGLVLMYSWVSSAYQWTEHQSLGNTVVDGCQGGGGIIQCDKLLVVGEVGLKPGEG